MAVPPPPENACLGPFPTPDQARDPPPGTWQYLAAALPAFDPDDAAWDKHPDPDLWAHPRGRGPPPHPKSPPGRIRTGGPPGWAGRGLETAKLYSSLPPWGVVTALCSDQIVMHHTSPMGEAGMYVLDPRKGEGTTRLRISLHWTML